jgi:hypothetical protein
MRLKGSENSGCDSQVSTIITQAYRRRTPSSATAESCESKINQYRESVLCCICVYSKRLQNYWDAHSAGHLCGIVASLMEVEWAACHVLSHTVTLLLTSRSSHMIAFLSSSCSPQVDGQYLAREAIFLEDAKGYLMKESNKESRIHLPEANHTSLTRQSNRVRCVVYHNLSM